MDGSRRSAHGNAYLTGFGTSKRIVFFDTLLSALQGDEVIAVLAHELGHYKLAHVPKKLIAAALLSLAGWALLGWLSSKAWFYAGLGVTQPSNYTALLLFMMAGPVFAVFLRPILELVAPLRIRGRRLRARCFRCGGLGARSGQALPRQREFPDARSRLFRLLSHPPATSSAHPEFAGGVTSLICVKTRSSDAISLRP